MTYFCGVVIINEASKIKFATRVGTFYRVNVTQLRRVFPEAPGPEVKWNVEKRQYVKAKNKQIK